MTTTTMTGRVREMERFVIVREEEGDREEERGGGLTSRRRAMKVLM